MKLVALLLLTFTGCATPTCDELCQAENGSTAAAQTSYWQFHNLAGGSPQIALFGDHTGRMRFEGPSGNCKCPIGMPCGSASIVPQDFEFSVTGPGTLLIANGGLVFECIAPATGSETITSIANLSGGIASAVLDLDVSFGGALQHHTGALVSGTF